MKPLEFLAEVLPSAGNGYYCLAELTTNKKEHVFAESLEELAPAFEDRKSTRLNSSHITISYAVFCL